MSDDGKSDPDRIPRAPGPYEPDFGALAAPAFPQPVAGRGKFRIAVLGDFSGRANRGALETGAGLAERKGHKLDVDTLERMIGRFRTALSLPIGADGGAVQVELASVDDLHPDELYGAVDLFAELSGLRARVKSGMAKTMDELRRWGLEAPAAVAGPRRVAGAVPSRRLDDFASLIGAKAAPREPAGTDALIRGIVGPHVVAAPSPDQKSMLAAVDAALSDAMRRVLHHPDFQTVEAGWRGLDLLARRVETDEELELTVFDIAAEEFAADLSAGADLSGTGLFTLLAEKPIEDEGEGAFGAIFGFWGFEETPPHAELLGRMARIAAHVGAPFVAAISTGFLAVPPEDRHPLVKKAWDALRAMPEARYLGLATPRFLLRQPYGRRTDAIDSFAFEEFTAREGIRGMLMANPALLVAILLAATVKEGGRTPELGSVMTLDDMPFHVMTDEHGDQVALPCTERLFGQRAAAAVQARGFMPVVSIKGRNEVRLAAFQSLGGGPLRGPWNQSAERSAAPVRGRGVGIEIAVTAPAATPPRAAPAADVATAAAAPAAPAGGGDLDALLAGLGTPAAAPAGAGAGLDDLDALLAGLESPPAEPSSGGIDDELKALLGDL